jgi:hypothetical protein
VLVNAISGIVINTMQVILSPIVISSCALFAIGEEQVGDEHIYNSVHAPVKF